MVLSPQLFNRFLILKTILPAVSFLLKNPSCFSVLFELKTSGVMKSFKNIKPNFTALETNIFPVQYDVFGLFKEIKK